MVGRGDLGQAEQPRDHPPDLILAGASVPAYRTLDLLGGVRARRDPALAGGQQHHPAGLADRERGPGVGAEVQLLDRNRIRAITLEQLHHMAVNLRQPALEPDAGGRLDHAGGEHAQGRPGTLDHAVAGAGGAGVDSNDDHWTTILRREPDASPADGYAA